MSAELMAVVLVGSLLVLLALGVPVTFSLGGIAVLLGLLLIGPQFLTLIPPKMWEYMNKFTIIAAPLFVFMAALLERTGIADDLFKMFHNWLGFLPGGLAIGTVLICTIFAAMSGVAAAAAVTMGMIALPAMLKRGYSKSISLGPIAAGAGLGLLIPPSILMVVIGMLAGTSVGRLFMGGVLPGLLLSFLFIVYIGVRVRFQPSLAPSLPPGEERLSWREKFVLLRGVIIPIIVVLVVLGSIFAGIASPTEAAALGALSVILIGLGRRSLSWQDFKAAIYRTTRLTGMITWIIFGGAAFNALLVVSGFPGMVYDLFITMPGGLWTVLIVMQVCIFIMGMILDPWVILMVVIPLFGPIAKGLGIDMTWFYILFAINITTGLITPPFGYNIFYLKGIITEDMGISMGDLYRSMLPFVAIMLIGLVLVMIFPQLALWLPNLMLSPGG